MTDRVSSGDHVTVAYVGRFEDGSAFAASDPAVVAESGLVPDDEAERTPLTFTVGAEEVIDGLDRAVVGMTAGEEATVTVPPEDAYGEYDPNRVQEYDVETFEAMVGRSPEVGLHVEAQNDLHGDVTAVADGVARVDFNHELAGRTLVFDLHVLTIE